MTGLPPTPTSIAFHNGLTQVEQRIQQYQDGLISKAELATALAWFTHTWTVTVDRPTGESVTYVLPELM